MQIHKWWGRVWSGYVESPRAVVKVVA